MEELKKYIRDIPDFPEKGIVFRDITTLLANPEGMSLVISGLKESLTKYNFDVICGMDARGFIFGALLANEYKKPFVPIRKKGKLPFETISQSYELEYGKAEVEIHRDAISFGQKVLLVDDLIATGGTAVAGVQLIRSLGGHVECCSFVIGLTELQGIVALKKLAINVETLISY